jgi:hypothetical protein
MNDTSPLATATRLLMEKETLERKLKTEKKNSWDWYRRYEKAMQRAKVAEAQVEIYQDIIYNIRTTIGNR